MTDELLRSAALGVVATLLGFELLVAARSWFDTRPRRSDEGPVAPWLGRTDHGPVLISGAFALRGHFAERRGATNSLRRQYGALRTTGYGRHLRAAIGRARPGPGGLEAVGCPSCRAYRLRGAAHCLECRRRLVLPAVSAGAWART